MTIEATELESGPRGEDLVDAARELLRSWAQERGASSRYAELLARVIDSSVGLRDREDLLLANLLHASVRSSTTTDGAPPEEMAVLTAPDLGIEREGASRPLPREIPAEAAALHELLTARRSVPYFGAEDLPLETLGALLRLALGVRELTFAYNRRDVPSRMFPSAGGLQPVDAYVIAHRVAGLSAGVYFYNPISHAVVEQELGDFRAPLVEAAIHTDWLFYAPVVIALVGRLPRVSWKYGTRGYRYLHVDTGVATMNLYLAGQSLDLHGNAVAAFDDDALNELLRLDGSRAFANLLFAAGRRPAGFRT
jgi:SagB-type dehydrogenase family enzyme